MIREKREADSLLQKIKYGRLKQLAARCNKGYLSTPCCLSVAAQRKFSAQTWQAQTTRVVLVRQYA